MVGHFSLSLWARTDTGCFTYRICRMCIPLAQNLILLTMAKKGWCDCSWARSNLVLNLSLITFAFAMDRNELICCVFCTSFPVWHHWSRSRMAIFEIYLRQVNKLISLYQLRWLLRIYCHCILTCNSTFGWIIIVKGHMFYVYHLSVIIHKNKTKWPAVIQNMLNHLKDNET